MASKNITRKISIFINGKQVENNLGSVGRAVGTLRRELKKLTPGTQAFIDKSKKLKDVKRQYALIKREIEGVPPLFKRMTKGVGGFLGAFGIGLGITGVIRGVQNLTTANAELGEAQADVIKTTGLTKKEVDELTKSLKKIDTRTGITELLGLAESAGRLNIKGKKDIEDFVRATDKSFVALGDSLEGTAADIGLTLGKLAGNFDLDKKYGISDAMNKIGSALNELGANSKASEGPIVDFTRRLAGVSAQAEISLPNIAALGALFDENGQSVEVSATTFNKLLPAIGKDVERFAKIAGLNVKDFKKIVEEDAFEALKLVAVGAKSNQKGLLGLTETLKDYGIDSARAASIVGILSSKTDRLTELQKIANDAFKDGTSLTQEFNLKNQTLGAILAKIGNTISQKFTGKSTQDFLKGIAVKFLDITKYLTTLDITTSKWWHRLVALSKIVIIVITSIVSYNLAIKLATFWTNSATTATAAYNLIQKITAITSKVLTLSIVALEGIFFLLTGQIQKAKIALISFNIITKTSPIGLLVGAIAAATTAYLLFSNAADKSTTSQKAFNSVNKRASSLIADEKSKIELLLSTAKNEQLSKKERIKAIKELNELSPTYLGNIRLETINTSEATTAIGKYIEAMTLKIEAQAAEKLFKEKNKQLLKAEADLLEETTNKTFSWEKAFLGIYGRSNKKKIEERIEDIKKQKDAFKELWEARVKALSKIPDPTPTTITTTANLNSGGDGDALTPEDEKILRSKKILAKFLKEFADEQEIQKQLDKVDKDQRDEKEETLRIDKQFQKMAEDAGFKTIKAASLEEAHNAAIAKVTKKWTDKRAKTKKVADDKASKQDAKFKKAQINAEEDLLQAKREALHAGIGLIQSFFKEGSAIAKILFVAQKIVAAAQVVVSGVAERAKISEVWGWAPPIATPMLLASKIRTGIGLATIAATAIRGFDKGGFTSSLGYTDSTGHQVAGIVHANEYVIPQAVLNQTEVAPIVQYLEAKRTGVPTFVEGGNTTPTAPSFTTETTTTTEDNNLVQTLILLVRENTEVLKKLNNEGVIAVMSNDLQNAKQIREAIQDYESLRNKNKI